ncbi:unnamed protein product, partial [Laminaria digitata]
AATVVLPPPGYCCGRVLYAWEDAALRGADQRPLSSPWGMFCLSILCYAVPVRVLCGVAATADSVTSEDLAAVASEMEGGTRARIKAFSDRPGVRALIKAMESG